jgi:Ca2+-binding EF-hand superfamily protein
MVRSFPLQLSWPLTFALLLAWPSPAAHAGPREQVGAASAGIRRLDTNGDGLLSRDEHAAAARKMFDEMDANKDGKVTAEEIDSAHAHVKGRRPSRSMKAMNLRGADKIKLSDANKDGVLTADEHMAAAMANFARMDHDKNGQLTSAELAANHGKLLHKGKH